MVSTSRVMEIRSSLTRFWVGLQHDVHWVCLMPSYPDWRIIDTTPPPFPATCDFPWNRWGLRCEKWGTWHLDINRGLNKRGQTPFIKYLAAFLYDKFHSLESNLWFGCIKGVSLPLGPAYENGFPLVCGCLWPCYNQVSWLDGAFITISIQGTPLNSKAFAYWSPISIANNLSISHLQ